MQSDNVELPPVPMFADQWRFPNSEFCAFKAADGSTLICRRIGSKPPVSGQRVVVMREGRRSKIIAVVVAHGQPEPVL